MTLSFYQFPKWFLSMTVTGEFYHETHINKRWLFSKLIKIYNTLHLAKGYHNPQCIINKLCCIILLLRGLCTNNIHSRSRNIVENTHYWKASRCKVLGVYNTNHRMIIQRDGSIHSRNVTMYMNHMQKGSTIHVSAVEMLVQVHRQASSFIFSSKIELRLQCISLESFACLHLHYQHLFFNDQNMFSSTSFSYIGLARDDCITR